MELQTSPQLKLIAIVSETIDVDGFIDVFVGGEVYLDSENSFKRILGGGEMRKASLGFLVSPSFWLSYRRASVKYPSVKAASHSNDGFNLGGVLAVAPESIGGALVYMNLEESIGGLVDLDRLSLAISPLARSSDEAASE